MTIDLMCTKETITTRVLVIGSIKASGVKRRQRIRISGLWLYDFGFAEDTLVICEFGMGKAAFKAAGRGIETYSKYISDIRQNGGHITQVKNTVHNKKRTPHFEVSGFWLARYGFNTGDVIALYCRPGLIEVIRLDVSKARGFH